MVARIGQRKGNKGLTPQQRTKLEGLVLTKGIGLGVTALAYKLRKEDGVNAPSRAEVADFLREQPSHQLATMPKSVTGKENAIAPVIPKAIPMSRVFADSMFLPASYQAQKGKTGIVYKAAVLYVDGLTKFIHIEPVEFMNGDRPMASIALHGYKTFIDKCRTISGLNLDPEHLRTDGGSEFLGVFKTWEANQRQANAGFYAHTTTTSGRASGNSVGERSVATIRRLIYAKYRAQVRAWDLANVPRIRRR